MHNMTCLSTDVVDVFISRNQAHCLLSRESWLAVRRLTVLYHFRKNDLMPVIKWKNDKHLVTLYTVIFSNVTSILSHLSYISY